MMLFAKKPPNPLEHFEINYYTQNNFFFLDFSLNTLALYLFWSFIFFFFLWILWWILVAKYNFFYLSVKNVYTFFLSFNDNLPIRALRFLPLLVFLFIFIFFLNFSSLVLYNIAVTGNFVITLYLSFAIFVGIIIVAFINHQLNFLEYFKPIGVPEFLLPFLIFIEVVSFLIRPFSLSIRLFANMLAGHTLMNIFGAFSGYITNYFVWLVFVPVVVCLCILSLEVGVCLIQAYVFVVLVTVYIQDIYYLH